MPSNPSEMVEVLRRDPLRNIVLLKLLIASPEGATLHQVVDGEDAASLLIVDHRFSQFDRDAYPEAANSVILSSNRADLSRQLLALVPDDSVLIFKLMSEADRALVAESYRLTRRTAYHSFTSELHSAPPSPAVIRRKADELPYSLFATQGHQETWLRSLLERGHAFAATLCVGDQVVSACLAFQIDASVWEVGGVYTLPAFRGRGLARHVVAKALDELRRQALLPRYQVAEDNSASIHLARSVGLAPYMTLTHYRGDRLG